MVPISTKGDRIQDRSLAAIGGKGLFIKELEVAIEERRADIAVHSMKDVPSDLPEGFLIAAVLPRADPRDALLTPKASRVADLPQGARLGTSSLRRQAQMLSARPDLRIETLRGNVDTRLRRLDDGELDAIILACAGLVRLGWESRITARLDPEVCLPAVSQGIIGIECRRDDAPIRALLAVLDDAPTRAAMDAERAFAGRLGGSCQSPIAAHATLDGASIDVARTRGGARWVAAAARLHHRRRRRFPRPRGNAGGSRAGRRCARSPRTPSRRLNMLRLQGVGVLVTRPEQQAERLCALLEAEGAVAVRLPAIDIKPVPGAHDFDAGPMASPPFDLAIFTSTNAVRFGAALLERLPRRRRLPPSAPPRHARSQQPAVPRR